MGINILICDEDRISLKINVTYIEEFSHKYKIKPDISIFSIADQKLYNYIKQTNIDIAILDTVYHNCSGMSLAKDMIKKNSCVSIIFITEHTEYALQAFNLLALGFIQKPIHQLQLEKLFTRAILQAQSFKYRKSHGVLNIIMNKSAFTIKQNNIIYIEKNQQKTKIVTLQSTYEVYETLSSIEKKLGFSFIRINQSVIVNMENISSIEGNNVYIKYGLNFKIGRTYIKKVKELYSNYRFIQ